MKYITCDLCWSEKKPTYIFAPPLRDIRMILCDACIAKRCVSCGFLHKNCKCGILKQK